ncbi:MAG: hypothetical protein Q4D96_00695 [Propionibacteriaceae bacterium]|nr:hypothetical protein [Propionibacteriaceae bacterium]
MLGATIGLTACSGSAGGGTGGELTKDTLAELTLFYWGQGPTPTVEANIKAFNEQYPKIKVTPSVAVHKDYSTKLRTQAEGISCQTCSG